MTRAFLTGAVLLLSATAVAQTTPGGAPSIERSVVTAGRGPQKLRVDVPLVVGGQRFAEVAVDPHGARARGGLGDLRLFDRTGREIAYLLIDPPSRRAGWIDGSILEIAQTRKTSGFEVDLGNAVLIDALAVEGLPAPFLKRLVLEGSGDRARWTVLSREGTLFDLPEERVRQTSLEFTPGSYRYLRVTWDDTNSGRLATPRHVRAREGMSRPRGTPIREAVPFERQASEPGRSRYRLRLPGVGLPIAALVFDVGPGDVFRTATALESRFSGARADPMELGRARLVQRTQPAGTAGLLRLPIERPRSSEVQVVVEDGNNPPLTVDRISIELAELPWIYFEAPDGPVTARYGNRTTAAPQYDLEAKRTDLDLDALPEASWGDPRPASTTGAVASDQPAMPDRGAKLDSAGFRYRRELRESAGGLVALQLDAAALSHSTGPQAGFADMRVVDNAGFQIPYLLERRDEPLSLDLSLETATPDIRALREITRNRSVYAIVLPFADLPSPRLVLQTSDRVFRRPLQIGIERAPDRQHREAWFEVLATREWQHADQGTPATPLEIALSPRDATRLLLIVEEGDNRPLALSGARLLLPSWRLRFFRPQAPLQLVYGRANASVPQYDLALLAPAVLGAEAREISAAPETAAAPAAGPILSPWAFWVGLAVAVVILLGLILRLISSGTAGR